MPAVENATTPKSPSWEYRSRFQLFGLPFIHLRSGGWQNAECAETGEGLDCRHRWRRRSAFCSRMAAWRLRPSALALVAIGLFSYGAMAVGALAVGGFAFGIWAFGAFAFGWQASAACAIAWNLASGGQYAIAHHFALGPVAHAAQANNDFVKHLWS